MDLAGSSISTRSPLAQAHYGDNKNKPIGPGPLPWTAAGVLARPDGGRSVAIGYPTLPATRYVIEGEVELTSKDAVLDVYPGGARGKSGGRSVLEAAGIVAARMRPGLLARWHLLVVGWPAIQRRRAPLSFRVVVVDGQQMLFTNRAPGQALSATAWPMDCALCVESHGDPAIVHNITLRPLTQHDAAQCGWEIPPTDLLFGLEGSRDQAEADRVRSSFGSQTGAGLRSRDYWHADGLDPARGIRMGSREPKKRDTTSGALYQRLLDRQT